MCRRSLEASCNHFKAEGKSLWAKIDNLADSGVITSPLKELAHQVRLEGNQGAHDATLDDLDGNKVDAVISFAREFFHHVHVIPERLKKIREKA